MTNLIMSTLCHLPRVERVLRHSIKPYQVLGCVLILASTCATAAESGYRGDIDPGSPIIGVEVMIGESAKALFFIDTGATHSMLDVGLATSIGLNSVVHVGSTPDARGQQMRIPYVRAPDVKIGTLTVKLERIGLMDFAFMREYCGLKVMGFLGVDALADKILDLNFDKRTIRIYRANDPDASFGDSIFVRRSPGMSKTLDVSLGGSPFAFTIDTGSNGDLSVRDERLQDLLDAGIVRLSGTPDLLLTPTGVSGGRNGHFVAGDILGLDLRGMDVSAATDHESVGLGFLRAFNVAIDFPNSRLYYTRRNAYLGTLDAEEMLGAALSYKEGKVLIRPIICQPNTPTKRLKLADGDELIQIGTLQQMDINASSLWQVIQQNAGKRIRIVVRRDGSIVHDELVELPAPIYHRSTESF